MHTTVPQRWILQWESFKQVAAYPNQQWNPIQSYKIQTGVRNFSNSKWDILQVCAIVICVLTSEHVFLPQKLIWMPKLVTPFLHLIDHLNVWYLLLGIPLQEMHSECDKIWGCYCCYETQYILQTCHEDIKYFSEIITYA